MAVVVRDLHTLDDFALVVALEERVWGLRDDVVPVSLLAAAVPRGAVLLGAFDADECVGFTYSFPALALGRLIHWSHMTAVVDGYRRGGVARRLKLAQRDRVRAMGIDRIDWTFDPLVAVNAHFNLRRLGALVDRYEVNVYGASASPLHGAIPTDRLVAQWWIDSEHVAARLADEPPAARAPEALLLNPMTEDGAWIPSRWAVPDTLPACVAVAVPPRFEALLTTDPALALEWRLASRRLFQALLAAGFRVSDFVLDEDGGGGRYLLVQEVS